MRLYSGSTENFVEDATRWAIAEKLRSAFFDYFRYYPSEHEVNAWDNSLGALAENVKGARLFDQGIMIEYQLPPNVVADRRNICRSQLGGYGLIRYRRIDAVAAL